MSVLTSTTEEVIQRRRVKRAWITCLSGEGSPWKIINRDARIDVELLDWTVTPFCDSLGILCLLYTHTSHTIHAFLYLLCTPPRLFTHILQHSRAQLPWHKFYTNSHLNTLNIAPPIDYKQAILSILAVFLPDEFEAYEQNVEFSCRSIISIASINIEVSYWPISENSEGLTMQAPENIRPYKTMYVCIWRKTVYLLGEFGYLKSYPQTTARTSFESIVMLPGQSIAIDILALPLAQAGVAMVGRAHGLWS